MKLTGQTIRHINTITHEGKVLVFGTAADGAIYYSVKRSGFEDSAVQEGADPFGFEDWKPLALGGSTPDASVVARDRKNLTDANGNPIMRSVHGGDASVTKSADAPVQLVSAASHLFVFRQAPGAGGRILVNRFVLDGMTNTLMPKLEVRFRRSRQRFEPQKSVTSGATTTFDSLDYRDVGNSEFLEPALELSFAGSAASGWFAPLFVPTIEPDRGRWHLFVVDAATGKLVLYTVGADAEGAFDVKDYLFGQVDPARPDVTLYRPIAGVIRRALDLQNLTVAGGPSATTYDVQREQITDSGPQLVRDAARVMLAVPVRVGGADPVKTAIVDFAIATDGTLSQVDTTPDASTILRSTARELITPLTLLDDIKEVASATPPPSGTIVATERGGDDLLQIRSREPLAPELVQGSKVWVRGTQSYDGYYKVVAVDGAAFRVEASFQNNEAGFWEVVPDKATGLVFDNMIVGAEKSVDGKLKVLCPAHDLKAGDEVQISGTRVADGTFPVKSVDAGKGAFVLDTPFFTGMAANLSRVMRRGLRMDVGDRVDSPDLGLEPPSPQRDLGRTISAWVRIDAVGQVEQNILRDSGGLMSLAVGAGGTVQLTLRMSDKGLRKIVDQSPLQPGVWTHYAGSVEYSTRSGGDTRLALCRGGVEVAALKIPHTLPCHLENRLPSFEGNGYVEVAGAAPLITGSFTIALWARVSGGASSHRAALACRGAFTGVTIYANANNQWEIQTGNGSAWASLIGPAVVQGAWTHVAIVVQGPTMTLYVNGAPQGSAPTSIQTPDKALRIGAGATEGPANFHWRGQVADVAIWKRALSPAELNEGMTIRHNGAEADIAAYWPLDNGAYRDLARGKRHGKLQGIPVITVGTYLHPQIAPPAAANARKSMVMSFDGVADFVEVPPFPNPTAALTISAWVKSATPTWSAGNCLMNKPGAFTFFTIAGSREISALFLVNWGVFKATFTPTDIQSWHHYAATWDGSVIRFFIDGAQVAQTNAPGTVSANADGALRIGRDIEDGAGRYFKGQITDVQLWGVARSQADIVADMNRRLTGAEQGLAGYWPLDVGPSDLSPLRRNGSLKGKPARIPDGSSFIVGGGFRGEIAEAQVWTRARPAAEVKATMHIFLGGSEPGLALNYRLGAVIWESGLVSMPDFSVNARAGVVTGEPYAGARRLNRQTGSGMKVVQYRSGELLAVSQRGLYEESFEFKVTSPDPNFDPANADGAGLRLFSFSYWGQANRSSKEAVPFPLGSAQQTDFTKLDGGWWRASCRVIIPDGVSLMRAFGIADVRGRWGNEPAPPAGEWTAIDVRKHRIRLFSDSVTRADYTDQASLASLGAPALEAALAEIARAENEEAYLLLKCADLEERIDVAKNAARYIDEQATLTRLIPEKEKEKKMNEDWQKQFIADPDSYWYMIIGNQFKLAAEARDETNCVVQNTPNEKAASQLFGFVTKSTAPYWTFKIINKGTGKPLTGGGLDMPVHMTPTESHQLWSFVSTDTWPRIRNEATGWVWDLKNSPYTDETIITFTQNTQPWQLFEIKRIRMVEGMATLLGKIAAHLVELTDNIGKWKTRLARLNELIAGREDPGVLDKQHEDVLMRLSEARKAAKSLNRSLLTSLAQPQAAALVMPTVAIDDRDLETRAAVLDFTRPYGATRLFESVEGNVLLTYGDARGRMRVVPYDAAADSRNASFEQWLPDGVVRSCYCTLSSGDSITFEQPIYLPPEGATIEGWVQYPLEERPLALQVLAGNPLSAPLALRHGRRPGILVNGFFFSTNTDLGQWLTAGWHHLASSRVGAETSFYADGVKIGTATATLPVLRFNGTTDYLEVPSFKPPAQGMTISFWARDSRFSVWKLSNPVISAPSFIFTPIAGTTSLDVTIVGDPPRHFKTEVPFTEPWHLYTLTYDDKSVALYLDGELVGERAPDGKPQGGSGSLFIGRGPGGCFSGDIAEVSFWEGARSAALIREDFLFRPLKGTESGLIGYWRMEVTGDDGNRRVKDVTGKTGDAVVCGAPTDGSITGATKFAVRSTGRYQGSKATGIGRLAELRLWDVGLSAAEIAANARGFLTGREPGLVAYFPLDEGAGSVVRNRADSDVSKGTLSDVTDRWVAFTAAVGNPASGVLSLPDAKNVGLKLPAVNLANRSFTIECWARQSSTATGEFKSIASLGVNAMNAGFFFGFEPAGGFLLCFYNNDAVTPVPYTDTDWHHWCGTYDLPSGKQRIYRDGVLVAERTALPGLVATGALLIGGSELIPQKDLRFSGEIAELRIWDRARLDSEIQANMGKRLTGAEEGLLALYPLDEQDSSGRVRERRAGTFVGSLSGNARIRLSTTLPIAIGDAVAACEYSTVRVDDAGQQRAIMRRFYASANGGQVELMPELRVEDLTLAWIGNTQIRPQLLGYIEGAPPVPSENMTLQDDYDTATTVTLSTADETTYTWRRSELNAGAVTAEGFLGAGWENSVGTMVLKQLTSGSVGVNANYEFKYSDKKESTVTTNSKLNTVDTLVLTGQKEDKPMSPVLGRRWIPKNIGYATVISGTADVFVTRLRRSGRMVSYEIRPIADVPLDVNTITFLINPAYTMNGSLDGMVGSMAADPTFYGHVPAMRAQYGSHYPASYFRLKEAYDLKNRIDRADTERESYFHNFNITLDSFKSTKAPPQSVELQSAPSVNLSSSGKVDEKAMASQKENIKAQAEVRQKEIEARTASLGDRVRASAALAEWQERMADIQVEAGKRNIVNTYVWDSDGGLHTEQQSFAGTIEHSFTTDMNHTAGLGGSADIMFGDAKFTIKVIGSYFREESRTKSVLGSKSLELNVTLMGDPGIHVENNGVTDLKDNPLVPGEKVGRYRFMSFYLEGSTNNFYDFFDDVVDPEWLMSNSEEARALRQARTGRPIKTWRVLHRVTYVERPALKKFGK